MTVELVVLDVNETLSDLSPLRKRFTDSGAPAHLLETWFAATLRDGFALAAAGLSVAAVPGGRCRRPAWSGERSGPEPSARRGGVARA